VLRAATDLIELLRLAQGASDRLEHEVHGASYEQVDLIARDLQRLRRQAERLKTECERFVSREESETVARGHPLRRAADRGYRAPLPGQRPS